MDREDLLASVQKRWHQGTAGVAFGRNASLGADDPGKVVSTLRDIVLARVDLTHPGSQRPGPPSLPGAAAESGARSRSLLAAREHACAAAVGRSRDRLNQVARHHRRRNGGAGFAR